MLSQALTAAWMKTHHADYAPWVMGSSIEEYCNSSILPISSELENVSLSALKDVILSPAGITLEVLYLDRSQGSEVNMHRFSPVNHGGYDIGTIRLLYRP
jgi:ubiquitin thioesterase protein OTUB1